MKSRIECASVLPHIAAGSLLVLAVAGCGDSPGEANDTLGTVRVTNATTPATVPGPESFMVQAGPGRFVIVDFNSAVVIDSVPVGALSLDVDLGVSYCSVPADPVDVDVEASDTTTVHLDISCAWGHLEVELPTTGPNQPTTLFISLDGVALGGAAPNTAGLGFPNVPAGPHEAAVVGLGSNCTVAEPNPQPIDIPFDDTLHITFTITCT